MSKKYQTLFTLLFLTCVGCGPEDNAALPTTNELTKMTAEERKRKAPNQAFEAVYLNNQEVTESLLNKNMAAFNSFNGDGQTALMVATTLRRKEISKIIIENFSMNQVLHKDKSGRGYISYFSEQGFVQHIDIIAEKHKISSRYYHDFSEVDFLDERGRRALFYAANGAVAQRLKEHWTYGVLESSKSNTWWSDFYQNIDTEGNSFLHSAAKDNRSDVIYWYAKDSCGKNYLEDFDSAIIQTLGWLWDRGTTILQNSEYTPIPHSIINTPNNTENTPLHLAARHGNKEALSALMACQYIEYGLENNFGRNPLSELVSHIEKNKRTVSKNWKESFDQLVTKKSRTWYYVDSVAAYINQQDHEGNTALHYAAPLSDQYFYRKMEVEGNALIQNNHGMTAQEVYGSGRKLQ